VAAPADRVAASAPVTEPRDTIGYSRAVLVVNQNQTHRQEQAGAISGRRSATRTVPGPVLRDDAGSVAGDVVFAFVTLSSGRSVSPRIVLLGKPKAD